MVLSGSRWSEVVHPKLSHVVVSASGWSWREGGGLKWHQGVPDGAKVMICSRFDTRKIVFCHNANN